MRRVLILLLCGGLVFLAYEYTRRTSRPVRAADSAPPKPNEPAPVTELQPAAAPADPREILLEGGEIELGPDARLRHPLGSPARYALEVLLAGRAAAGSELESLRAAAAAMVEGLDGDEARRQAADLMRRALERLLEGKHWAAGVAALGGCNLVLAAEGGARAVHRFASALARLDDEPAVMLASALLDALTHGLPFWAEHQKLIAEILDHEQEALDRLLCRPDGSWHSLHRKVPPNGTLDGIAQAVERELKIPLSAGLLQMVNGITDPRRLRAGQRIRVPTDPMRVVVEKHTYTMKVFLGRALFRLYMVGLGKEGRTPRGEFVVVEKERYPRWVDPRTGKVWEGRDPNNPLGGYFIKLDHPDLKGYGIHGTNDMSSIGRPSSMGCVRLGKDDMAEVFLYLPRRARLVVVESPRSLLAEGG